MSAWKLTTDWGFSVIDAPRVPLKVDELDEDSVVIGEGISFPVILLKFGALGLLSRLVFLVINFFFPSSSCSLIQ